METDAKPEPKYATDAVIRAHEDHDDAIYGTAWSTHSAWIYASLSGSGKVVFYQVPSADKYKILLCNFTINFIILSNEIKK